MKQNLYISDKSRKQRKQRMQANDSERRLLTQSRLSENLRKTYGRKTIPLVSGDVVRIIAGSRKNTEAKVERIIRRASRVYLEGQSRENSKKNVCYIPFDASNLEIVQLALNGHRNKVLKSSSN